MAAQTGHPLLTVQHHADGRRPDLEAYLRITCGPPQKKTAYPWFPSSSGIIFHLPKKES